MDPHKDSLLDAIVTLDAAAPPHPDTRDLVRSAMATKEIREVLQVLSPLLDPNDGAPLAEFLRLAVTGVAVAFVERNLSPHIEEHREIIPALLAEIRSVYEHIQSESLPYDPEEFRYRSYDYGIHKAYYLDWRLYLSKEMY